MEPAHIEDMDRFFFILLTVCIGFLALLFLPIYIHSDLYYDVNGRKCAFSVTAYRFLPIIGGYIATYNGGLAFHISKKKAILLPYNDMKQEQKKISVLRTFRLKTLAINIETGAEYFLYTMLAQRVFTAYFLLQGGKKEKLKHSLWLTDGNALRISLHCVLRLNGYIILRNVFVYLKEKFQVLCQTKIKESII